MRPLAVRGFLAPAMAAVSVAFAGVAVAAPDVVIRDGMIYDGGGGAPFQGDVAIEGDRITYVGADAPRGRREVDAHGLAVSPGFINMLSWGYDSLMVDGRGLSDLTQGVTLEVMGEGDSAGPLTAQMRRLAEQRQGDIKYPVTWTSFGEAFEHLEKRGLSLNVASFAGAATVRANVLGEAGVQPTPAQLDEMRAIVRTAMREGALGVGSSLLYVPGLYARTPELVALSREAARCGGMYISHVRSEGAHILESVDEAIEISRASGAPAEIYHLKAAGRPYWGELDKVLQHIDQARASGLRITADMYLYAAGATGLDAVMPPWVQEGGLEKWVERLQDPAIRGRVIEEMRSDQTGWENFLRLTGADKVLLIGFNSERLKPLTGKTLAEVARMRGVSPEEAAVELVVEDHSRVTAVYFHILEDNVRREVLLPYMSFGSDAEASNPDGVFRKYMTHPREYGNVPRLLGTYVRDLKLLPLEEAIRRLTSLPASNLGLRDRGRLRPGAFADVVVFDPATIADHATYEQPRLYSTGVRDVFVNGGQVLQDGRPTAARPGRFVRGPGWSGWPGGGACKAVS